MTATRLKANQLWQEPNGSIWQLVRPARRKEPCWIVVLWSDYGNDEEYQLPSEEIQKMRFYRDKA